MALKTLGTNDNNSLSAGLWNGAGSIIAADMASINNGVKDDIINSHPIVKNAFRAGILIIPNRGWLRVLQGDYVAFDATTGWPILISKNAIANGPWTHS